MSLSLNFVHGQLDEAHHSWTNSPNPVLLGLCVRFSYRVCFVVLVSVTDFKLHVSILCICYPLSLQFNHPSMLMLSGLSLPLTYTAAALQ